YENAPYVKRALADGAAGYLLKDATPEDLAQAINVAMSGSGNVLSPRVIQNLFDDQDSSVGSNGHSRRNEYSLTQREHDILAMLGVTNLTQAAIIALQMGVGPVPGALLID